MSITKPAYVTALHNLADLFESRDDLPLPYGADELVFYAHHLPDAIALHALIVKPVITCVTGTFPVRINGTLAGMQVQICIHSKVALSTNAPVLPALVPALAALMSPVKLASVPA